jgi:hypothetical protein
MCRRNLAMAVGAQVERKAFFLNPNLYSTALFTNDKDTLPCVLRVWNKGFVTCRGEGGGECAGNGGCGGRVIWGAVSQFSPRAGGL